MSSASISIVIPAFNAQKTIAQTLQAVLSQDYEQLFEVIVVDDGSTDKTAQIVQSFQQVRYIYQPNSGPATARNRGIDESHGELVCFTDSDCLPRTDWISELVRYFSEPNIAVVAGSYGIANDKNLLASCIHQEIIFRHNKLIPIFSKSFGSYNFCARKNILQALGGFDTHYRYASGEDNDLSYKILKAGYKIYFARSALVDHHHPEKVLKYLRDQFQHGFWRVKMYCDHPDMMVGDDYTFWKDVVEVPLVLVSLIFVAGFIFHSALLSLLGYVAFCVLLLLEFYFAFSVLTDFFAIPFWASVTALRAYARTFGFFSGLVEISLPKAVKKSK